MLLLSRLPVRFTDALEIEVDAGAAGKALTPLQALGLAEQLTHQAVRKQVQDAARATTLPTRKVMA